MYKMVYALLTRQCNLSCPHCDVKNIEDTFDREKFLDQLLKFNGDIVLFGGEPTIYRDRLFDVVNECKKAGKHIKSISTNLMILDSQLVELYKTFDGVATSWNPNRFNNIQYSIWIHNCKTLSSVGGIRPTILVTLDNDLLDMGVDEFLKVVDDWDSSMFNQLKLEYYCGDTTPEYFERVDDFLCEVYNKWRSNIKNTIVEDTKHWWKDCSGTYTIYPDGTMTNKCSHNVLPTVPTECYTCERADICKPCVLQMHCSFPKKFANLVNKGGN